MTETWTRVGVTALTKTYIDMVSEELGLHLSENQSEHVYRQTPEEGLIHTFRKMKVAKESHKDVELKEKVTGTPRMWADMLSQDYVWDFMERVEPMGIHMIDGKGDMSLNRLHRTMLGTSGGVSGLAFAHVLIVRTWRFLTTMSCDTGSGTHDRADGRKCSSVL